METHPFGAYILSAIGLAFHIIAVIVIVLMMLIASSAALATIPSMGLRPLSLAALGMIMWSILAVVFVALGGIGVSMMAGPGLNRIRGGSTLVLVVSILSFPTLWGFVLGSLLMFIGALLGLVWQPPYRPGAVSEV